MVWFREEQGLSRAFVWLTVLLGLGVCVATAVGLTASDEADRSWWVLVPLWLLAGLGLPLLIALTRLVVEVERDAVLVRYRPFFVRRRIPLAEIASADAVTYRPLREYGGWGIRGIGRRRAYNARGDRGVQLVLTDGRRVLLGSQVPEQLAAAILQARGTVHR